MKLLKFLLILLPLLAQVRGDPFDDILDRINQTIIDLATQFEQQKGEQIAFEETIQQTIDITMEQLQAENTKLRLNCSKPFPVQGPKGERGPAGPPGPKG